MDFNLTAGGTENRWNERHLDVTLLRFPLKKTNQETDCFYYNVGLTIFSYRQFQD